MTTVSYTYRAARSDGTVEHGTVQAPSRDVASSALADRGLWVLDVRSAASTGARDSLSAIDLALGLRLLGSLLQAGLPVGRALVAFGDVAPDGWRAGLDRVRQGVQAGQSLGAALAASLEIPAVVVGMIHAGEAGSGLSAAVLRAADLMEHNAATRSAIRSALVYPMVLGVAGSASVTLLIGIVLPRFAKILADLGQSLPPATRFVLDTGAVLRAAAAPSGLTIVAIWLAWRTWTSQSDGRRRWHGWLLGVPLVGAIRRAAAVARVSAALASLLDSGVPLATALIAGARTAGDDAIAARVLAARGAVLTGVPLSRALREADASTSMVTRLVRAGEESGRLAEMLTRAAALEADHAKRTVTGAVRLLEPSLILAFGAIVAVVAAALLQAIYSVRPT